MAGILMLAATISQVIVASPGGAVPQDLRVGVAVADITPPPDYRMSGYFAERISTGTHDPLQAKAIYLGQGDRQAILVFCDLVGIPQDITSLVREAASGKTGVPVSQILIAATHSHTGPQYFGALRRHYHNLAVAKNGEDPYERVDYVGELLDKLTDIICRAHKVAVPASLDAGVARESRLAFNRRYHMKDGSVVYSPGKLNPNIVRPAAPIDPEVGLLQVRAVEDGSAIALLCVFAMHPDTMGGTEYSADFPYYLEQELQQRFGGSFVSLFGTGTCGDVDHIDVLHKGLQQGAEETERIGKSLSETVLAALPTLDFISAPSLAVRSKTIEAPLQQFTEQQVEQALRDLQKVGSRELPFLRQVEAYKIASVHFLDAEKIPMEVQAFRLSDDVAIVGLPGELFVELGLAIKQASPFKRTFVLELCNDAAGYIPTLKAFGEGGYETTHARIVPGMGEMLVQTAKQLLVELKGGNR